MSAPFTVVMVSWVLASIQTHHIAYIKCVQSFNVNYTLIKLFVCFNASSCTVLLTTIFFFLIVDDPTHQHPVYTWSSQDSISSVWSMGEGALPHPVSCEKVPCLHPWVPPAWTRLTLNSQKKKKKKRKIKEKGCQLILCHKLWSSSSPNSCYIESWGIAKGSRTKLILCDNYNWSWV